MMNHMEMYLRVLRALLLQTVLFPPPARQTVGGCKTGCKSEVSPADHQRIKAYPFGCCGISDCLGRARRAKVSAHTDQARTRLLGPSRGCASQAARPVISAWVWLLCTFVGLRAYTPVTSTNGSKHSALAWGPSRHEKLFHWQPDSGAVTWSCR